MPIFQSVSKLGMAHEHIHTQLNPKFKTEYELNQGQASGMDGTLTLIFAISKTIRDSKKFIKEH